MDSAIHVLNNWGKMTAITVNRGTEWWHVMGGAVHPLNNCDQQLVDKTKIYDDPPSLDSQWARPLKPIWYTVIYSREKQREVHLLGVGNQISEEVVQSGWLQSPSEESQYWSEGCHIFHLSCHHFPKTSKKKNYEIRAQNSRFGGLSVHMYHQHSLAGWVWWDCFWTDSTCSCASMCWCLISPTQLKSD